MGKKETEHFLTTCHRNSNGWKKVLAADGNEIDECFLEGMKDESECYTLLVCVTHAAYNR